MLTASRFLIRLFELLGMGWGKRTLDCVEAPQELAHAQTARTRRMVRNARTSQW